MTSKGTVIFLSICILAILGVVFVRCTPLGRSIVNDYTHDLSQADENQYDTRKMVEDTARAMISSYKSDADTYKQYKDSDNKEKQGWAEQAKMRANRTANTYNEYILKNSHVWKDNIPQDIKERLPIIE